MAFSDCFASGMGALGFKPPTSLFADVTTALGTIGTLAKAVQISGKAATIGEIVGAGGTAVGLADLAIAAGAVTASFYLGAAIGCFYMCGLDWLDVTFPVPRATASSVLDQNNISLSDDMWALMDLNPEMLGAAPADDYQARMNYYAYPAGSSGTALV